MPQSKGFSVKTEYRRSKSSAGLSSPAGNSALSFASPHPADIELSWFVRVFWHDYVSCYVYQDSPVFNPYGEVIGHHEANAVYLNPGADHIGEDLLHEVGHAVARHFDLVGHRDNYYCSNWEQDQQRLIGAVTHGRHWSRYLNEYAAATDDFHTNAGSELWAELFMLFHLYPELPEAELISETICELQLNPMFQRLQNSLQAVRDCWLLPAAASLPRGYPGYQP